MKARFSETQSLLEQAVKDRFFSGASLLVFRSGEPLWGIEKGLTAYPLEGVSSKPVSPETLFDLASLTKPLVTAFLIALFIQERKLFPEEKVSAIIGEGASTPLSHITLFDLLNHSSGLPDWKPFYLSLLSNGEKKNCSFDKKAVYRMVHQETPVYPAGDRHLYSDPGYILLGEILEKKSGLSLDRLYEEKILKAIGGADAGFRPVDPDTGRAGGFGEGRAFAAAEKSELRGKIIQGEVDDDNAWAMGGVAGHAGLFGTARGVFTLFKEWSEGLFGRKGLLAGETVRSFVERGRFQRDWGLGWMFPSGLASTAGNLFSRSSFGHLGFTGTSLWYDPEADLGVILLTNRVHPTRENQVMKTFRPEIHDLIYREASDG